MRVAALRSGEPVGVSALFGPIMSLLISLYSTGYCRFFVGGNAEPLFPLAEMGWYSTEDGAVLPGLYARIRDALPGLTDNPRSNMPGAYFFRRRGTLALAWSRGEDCVERCWSWRWGLAARSAAA